MLKENMAVSICRNSDQVQESMAALARSDFDMNRVSVVGHAFGKREGLAACYDDGDQLKCWGIHGDFWNELSTNIRKWVLLSSPGTGPLIVIGPIALGIVAVLDNSAIFSGLSVLSATLYSMGLAKERAQDYEEALRNGCYLLIVHGPAQEIMCAKQVLKTSGGVRAGGGAKR